MVKDAGKGKYRKLEIDFEITPELSKAIDDLMNNINNGDGMSEDCYRCEIEFWLKDSFERLNRDQYQTLKEYYVLGDIYRDGYVD